MKKILICAVAAAAAVFISMAGTSCKSGSSGNAVKDTLVVNTTEMGKDIEGYNGPTPLEIKIVEDKIVEIKALPNKETPGFFKRVTDSGLLTKLVGKTVDQARKTHLDAVTGATYSSKAVIANITLALESLAEPAE